MARFGFAFPLIAGLALAAFGSAPAFAQAGDAHRGSALAQSWCAGCHVIAPTMKVAPIGKIAARLLSRNSA